MAAAKAAKLARDDRVDVILGGIYGSTRQAIKGEAAAKARPTDGPNAGYRATASCSTMARINRGRS